MDSITPLNASIPAIIEKVVARSIDRDYFNEFGTAKSEKVRTMTAELLDAMMGYLKTASLAHALADMKDFLKNNPSKDSGVELKALWTDIIDEATLANPVSKNLLHQVGEVFNRLIAECTITASR